MPTSSTRLPAFFSGATVRQSARSARSLQAGRVFASAKVPKVDLMMTRKPVCLKSTDPVEAAATLFLTKGFSHVPVVDDSGTLVGVLSETDMLFGGSLVSSFTEDMVERKVNAKTCGDAMTSDVISIVPTTAFDVAAHEMLSKKIHCLPVVDKDNKVVGIVTRKDILRYNYRSLPIFAN
eukprot:CAMPEP_0117683548 /NCGR_PEP_ID=MMETSP0804-20121206/20475_1 /TAXON_ID=1074897 /ORGANISM="Tetraselmis astigmatica, Strain CCMP880" /LENGTH=178 /DNA_ID=CAMNT_0005494181 /DNA_START=265 /DNA_END=801 /DNA_ORIENTATION=+